MCESWNSSQSGSRFWRDAMAPKPQHWPTDSSFFSVQRRVASARSFNNNNTKNKNKKQHTQKANNHTTTKKWRDSYQFMSEKIYWGRGDSLVSSRRMQLTTYVPCWRRPIKQNNNRNNHKITMRLQRVQEATKLNAETRDLPSQDPRDHREQPSAQHNTLTLWSKHRQSRSVAFWLKFFGSSYQ